MHEQVKVGTFAYSSSVWLLNNKKLILHRIRIYETTLQ